MKAKRVMTIEEVTPEVRMVNVIDKTTSSRGKCYVWFAKGDEARKGGLAASTSTIKAILASGVGLAYDTYWLEDVPLTEAEELTRIKTLARLKALPKKKAACG